MRLRAFVVLALVVATLLGFAEPGAAHSGAKRLLIASDAGVPITPDGASLVAGAPETSPAAGMLLLLLAAAAPALAGRRPRRALAVALAAVVVVFGFEAALHSVHHGFDHTAAAACQTVSLTAHTDGVSTPPIDYNAPTLVLTSSLPQQKLLAPAERTLGARFGRAPPSARV